MPERLLGFGYEMRATWEFFWEFVSRCMVKSLSEVREPYTPHPTPYTLHPTP